MGDYESLRQIVEDLLRVFGIEPKENTLAYLGLGLLAVVIFFLYVLRPIFNNRRWRKKQLDAILKGYERYFTRWQRWLYIKTFFQEKPPHDLPEPYDSQSPSLRTNSIDFFIKRDFKLGNQHPSYYFVLGGSGMGKTTFVVNLVRRYIKKYKEKTLPYPIKMLYCGVPSTGDEKLLNRINDIKKANIDTLPNTILILDALDENDEAINNYSVFFEQLWEKITGFRIVIITCRTQFFKKLEDEPNLLPDRDCFDKSDKKFVKYYISPFQDEEIDRYINKKYLLRFRAKRKAKSIINSCKQLMARPLLLSYLDDLLDAPIGNGEESIVQIYEILINKWIDRETNFLASTEKDKEEKNQTLRKFSNELALCMANSSYTQGQIASIIKRYDANTLIKESYLKGRSLLNRNSKNDFKFAHKSFMEFLVAMQLSEPNNSIPLVKIDLVSNDMIPIFLSYKFLGYRNIELYFTNTTYLSFKCIACDVDCTVAINLSIYLPCNISEYILKIVSAFVHTHHVNKISFVISCKDDDSRIIDIPSIFLDKKDMSHFLINLTFREYNFMNESVIKFIESADSLTYIGEVKFIIADKDIIKAANRRILKRLKELSESLRTITIQESSSSQVLLINDYISATFKTKDLQ